MIWLLANLIERIYYDNYSSVLSSIKGRKNVRKCDWFSGGGKLYPELGSCVVERYEHGSELLVGTTLTQAEADLIIAKDVVLMYQATPKIVLTYNFKQFGIKQLSPVEADKLLEKWKMGKYLPPITN